MHLNWHEPNRGLGLFGPELRTASEPGLGQGSVEENTVWRPSKRPPENPADEAKLSLLLVVVKAYTPP